MDKSYIIYEQVSIIFNESVGLMNDFKKSLYEDAFNKYLKKCRPVIEMIDGECVSHPEDRDKILKDCSEILIDLVSSNYENTPDLGRKADRQRFFEEQRMVLVCYTVPMIAESGYSISNPFADMLVKRWNERYPKRSFLKGSFSNINEGFQKKLFCYITTAVCESLNKPDDCYELSVFRQFRDGYVLKQVDGPQLISEYYEISPLIVCNINHMENKSAIYQEIWTDDLSVCLANLEAGDNRLCMQNYIRMMEKLKKRYSFSIS